MSQSESEVELSFDEEDEQDEHPQQQQTDHPSSIPLHNGPPQQLSAPGGVTTEFQKQNELRQTEHLRRQQDLERKRQEQLQQDIDNYDESVEQSTERLLRLQRLDDCGLIALQLMREKFNIPSAEVVTIAGAFRVGLPDPDHVKKNPATYKDMPTELNLKELVRKGPSTTFHTFSRSKTKTSRPISLTMKLHHPKVTATISKYGKVTLFGAKSTPDLYLAARRITHFLRYSGILPTAALHDFRVTNVNLDIKTEQQFHLNLLLACFRNHPELGADMSSLGFPCINAKYQPPAEQGELRLPPSSVKIFGNGTIQVTRVDSIAAGVVALDFWNGLITKFHSQERTEDESYGAFTVRKFEAPEPTATSTKRVGRGRPPKAESAAAARKRASGIVDDDEEDDYESDFVGDSESDFLGDSDSDAGDYSGEDSDWAEFKSGWLLHYHHTTTPFKSIWSNVGL